jgi:hypothetical protein
MCQKSQVIKVSTTLRQALLTMRPLKFGRMNHTVLKAMSGP